MVMRVVMVTLSTVVDVDRGNPTPAHAGGAASTGDDLGWWGSVRARHVHPMHTRHGKSELLISLLMLSLKAHLQRCHTHARRGVACTHDGSSVPMRGVVNRFDGSSPVDGRDCLNGHLPWRCHAG